MSMRITDETANFVRLHRLDDVRTLALKGDANGNVDMAFALNQIQGWQTARQKLPSWAAADGIVYPPHLNMEQCSSEATARYKSECLKSRHDLSKATLIDLTGGFGVDFSIMSQSFAKAVYVERNAGLVEVARHNFDVLSLTNVTATCADGTEFLSALPPKTGEEPLTVVYLDPARRDGNGKKVFRIEDCSPDIIGIRDTLLSRADVVMIKFSPMLDWHMALSQLDHDVLAELGEISHEVHIVSTKNECKELLMVMSRTQGKKTPTRIVCSNDGQLFQTLASHCQPSLWQGDTEDAKGKCLLVPNASIMKAGVFGELSREYGIDMLDHDSHLYISDNDLPGFPGRRFEIDRVSTMNKKDLRKALEGISQANVSARNFPLSADALRKKLRLKDGGDTYVFATTVGAKHLVFVCHATLTPCHTDKN